jgi:hypothetical protein
MASSTSPTSSGSSADVGSSNLSGGGFWSAHWPMRSSTPSTPQWVGLRARALVSEEAREGHVDEVRRVIRHIARGEGAEAAAVWRAHLEFFRREMLSA